MKRIPGITLALALQAFTPAFAADAPDTLGRIKAGKAITVAYASDSLPFAFTESNGEPMGYSVDLCRKVIAHVGRAVGEPNLKVTWVKASTPERINLVASGKVDFECGNTTETLSRYGQVDFSRLIFIESSGFLTRAGDPVASLSQFNGKKIAVLIGTTTETRLREALKKRLVNAEIVLIKNAEDGVVKLAAGDVDVYAGDKIKLVGLVTLSQDPRKFTLLQEDLSYEPYALALPRNDSTFRLEVNRALTQVFVGGEIEGIYNRWLGVLGRPGPVLATMYLLSSIPD
jgi:glutamate/aspartate transport system substrate-binding protein